jgi:hypothetical protein
MRCFFGSVILNPPECQTFLTSLANILLWEVTFSANQATAERTSVHFAWLAADVANALDLQTYTIIELYTKKY